MANAPGQGRKLKATTIAERRRERGEVIPDSPERMPLAPSYLNDVAKAEWKRTGTMLRDAGLFSKINVTALAAYCTAYARWVEAEEALKEYGTVIKAPSGFPIQSPYLAIANKAMDQMVRLMGEFGLTPAAQARIPAQKGEGGKRKRPKNPKPQEKGDPRARLQVVK